jgi:hypothetical protein
MRKPGEVREKSQLTLEWTETMRWRDVPPAVQERVRVLLRTLLSEAADRRNPTKEVADERV